MNAKKLDRMKPSGVPWLGDIPAGWDMLPIKSMFEITLGKMLASSQSSSTDSLENYLCAANIKWTGIQPEPKKQMWFSDDEKEQYLLSPGDVVIMEGGLAGTASIYQGEFSPCYFQNSVLRCRSRGYSESRYLFYWMHVVFHAGYIDSICNRSTIQHFTKEKVGNTPICTPTLPEQRAIADFLDGKCAAIDAIVEEAKVGIEEYAKWKQSVVFHAVTKGLDPHAKMKDSGVEWIGEIPEEWEVMPIKHIVNLLAGFAFKSEEFEMSGGIRLLRGINVGVNGLKWDECVFWNKPVGEEFAEYQIHKGDLIVGLDRPWIAEGTRVCFATDDDLPCLLVQRVCRIRSLGKTDLRIIKHWLASHAFEQALSCETTGISVPHISPRQIQEFRIAFPPLPEQRAIADYLDEKCAAIDALIEEKKQLIEDLDVYKKSLIYETVTGKRRIGQ